ncbi:MAG: AAA family ATPase [Lachnospiraceae bacterium]|jgi:hypothetical protein|nr:AAA family ATPase [Lachnospiraceae bacterium]
MKYRPLPIGISDFAEMIRKEFYYVDKTPMIKELLDNQAKVTLFMRPRRFGKTLNMSMLKYYFEDDRDWQGNRRDWADLFDRLKIMEAGESYLAHRGQYPVIYLTYFRKVREWMEEEIIYAELMIPNKEVRYIFSEKVQKWFHEKRKNRDMHPLHDAVIAKDCAVMTEEINDIFGETISYMDQNEFYYHGMMAGLLTGIKGYTVRSNRESGKGRSDLLVKPIRRSREAFVIEFKVTKDFQELDQKADEAIRQIVDRKYEMELINDGYKYISYYGIAFCGKECVVHCKPYE